MSQRTKVFTDFSLTVLYKAPERSVKPNEKNNENSVSDNVTITGAELTFFSTLLILLPINDYQRRREITLLPLVLLLIENEDDRQFLENVYLQYHRLMYAQALQILKQRQAAEDTVSDSLLALAKKIALLRTFECNKLRSYVVITVRHTAISHLNKGKREQLPGDAAFDEIAGTDRVDARLLEQAGIEGVKAAIRALPPREKDLMLMKYFREMTEQEIAGETGLKPVSVRVHLSRARKHLTQLLAERREDI